MLKKLEKLPWYIPFPISLIPLVGLSAIGVSYINQQQQTTEAAKNAQLTAVVKPKTVTALGKLAPKGEIIKLSAPTSADGVKIEKLLVEEGSTVKAGQLIAVLDSRGRLQASLNEAQEKVAVAQVSLEKVEAGAKEGEINAQKATIAKLQAEQETGTVALQATLDRVIAETETQAASQQATIAKLGAEVATQIEVQKGVIAETQAAFANAQIEDKRYATLSQQGAVSTSIGDTKRLTLETAKQKVNQAQANLNRIESSGKQQIAEAQANLSRIQRSGEQQINEAAANLRKFETSMEQQVKESEFTLDKIAEVRPVDVMAAAAEIKSAIASQKRAEENLAQAYIRSPQDAQIYQIYARPGEVVGTNGIAELGGTSQMKAIVEVYQSDINKVRVGQKVNITASSLASELQGTIERVGIQIKRQNTINADPTSNIDDRVVEVHVDLNPESSQKAANFTNLQIQSVIELEAR